MRTVELQVTVDASGDGVVTASYSRQGFIEAINLDYAATAAAGTDVTISCVGGPGQDLTILTVANANTDAWFYPRTVSHTLAGVAQAAYEIKLPFKGFLRLTVADGGNAIVDCVTATIFYTEDDN
jgi:hypothetical protein